MKISVALFYAINFDCVNIGRWSREYSTITIENIVKIIMNNICLRIKNGG